MVSAANVIVAFMCWSQLLLWLVIGRCMLITTIVVITDWPLSAGYKCSCGQWSVFDCCSWDHDLWLLITTIVVITDWSWTADHNHCCDQWLAYNCWLGPLLSGDPNHCCDNLFVFDSWLQPFLWSVIGLSLLFLRWWSLAADDNYCCDYWLAFDSWLQLFCFLYKACWELLFTNFALMIMLEDGDDAGG
jgi:hypothetical protein